MPNLSLILLLAFLIVIFPIRSLRRKKQFGSAPRVTYSRGRPLAWWTADLLFLTGFALVLAGPALELADLASLLIDPGTATIALSILIIVLAAGLAIWSQEVMGAAWRPDISPAGNAHLVTTGPFRIVRNPNYLAMLGTAGGATLLAPTAVGIVGVTVLTVGLALTARAEEQGLLDSYGAAYPGYASETGRFLPGIGLIREMHEKDLSNDPPKGNADE